MGYVENLKELFALIQKTNDLGMMRDFVELQQQVLALVDENGKLKDENRSLRDLQVLRVKVTFRNNSCWIDSDGPYCSRCWDADQKLIHLHKIEDYDPRCPACGNVAGDEDAEPPKAVARYRR